jgi:hypothetical protein
VKVEKIFAVVLAPALLAGCAAGAPVPPATLSYTGQNCESAPNLGRAASLTPGERKAYHTVTLPVDGLTPCLRNGAAPTPYILYAIPSTDIRMIEVGSQLEPSRTFSLQVDLLDQDGNRVRSFAPDQYLYRGGFFSIQFVPQGGERFILVTADPARIGQTHDAVAISTSTTTIWTGYGAASWTSGVDQNISRTFSYEGSVVAVVHSLESRER